MKSKFTTKSILVIGDVILDKYVSGTASRISPEAPVPVVRLDKSSEYRLGGAANVAANIKSLGGNPILIGATGNDYPALELAVRAGKAGIEAHLVDYSNRKTTVKTRLIANGQQIARMDSETVRDLTPDEESKIIERIINNQFGAAAFVICDYAKGVVTQSIFRAVMEIASNRQIPVFLDPKVGREKNYPGHLTAMTPNFNEAETMAEVVDVNSDAAAAKIGSILLNCYLCDNVLVTRGEHGMSLISRRPSYVIDSSDITTHIPTNAQHVFDVCGAGDTVIAALALAHASGHTMVESAVIANLAAGVAVGKHGTATVTFKELESEIERHCLFN